MKIRIGVRDVFIRIAATEMTTRQIPALVRHAASISMARGGQVEQEERAPLGFTANLERSDEYVDLRIDPDWFE